MSNIPKPGSLQEIKQQRDAALEALVTGMPYSRFLGVRFERLGDEVTAILPFSEMLIGNPMLPALHGGAIAAFLEVTSIIGLSWSLLWQDLESGVLDPSEIGPGHLPRLPKTIDLTVDYLRPGLPRDAYARAFVTRSGRRYASVRAEAWQDNRTRPIASAAGHFRMPGSAG